MIRQPERSCVSLTFHSIGLDFVDQRIRPHDRRDGAARRLGDIAYRLAQVGPHGSRTASMTPSERPEPIDDSPDPDVLAYHAGSASANLSGRAVVSSWFISILIHVLIFFVMIALVLPFSTDRKELPPLTTRVELIGRVDAGTVAPTPTDRPEDRVTDPKAMPIKVQPKAHTPLSALGGLKRPELSLIGIGAGGGESGRFSMSMGAPSAPKFFGLGDTVRGARSVVYVVDVSGSIVMDFPFVRFELKKSIGALRRSQKFHVLYFNNTIQENPPRRLVSAIEANKKQAFDFVDHRVVTGGGTRVDRALMRALELKPDIIYLLSDGEFDDLTPNLRANLELWNSDRLTRIFTLAFLDSYGWKSLEWIAREHGGEFRYVSEDDLPDDIDEGRR